MDGVLSLRQPRQWWSVLAVLTAVRVAIPVLALAANGTKLPGLPRYDYEAFPGDAAGFYSGLREFISALGRVDRPLSALLVVALVAAVVAGVLVWRRTSAPRWVAVWPALLMFSALVALAITEMSPPGAAVIGWSLVWGAFVLPFRAAGVITDDLAFALGFVLSLVAVAVTTVAVAFIGVLATGRRVVGLVAAGLWTLWPFIPVLVVGDAAWENGQWNVDVGLHLYTEPLSTALVAVAIVALLVPTPSSSATGIAGFCLGFATAVKLSNALIAIVLLPVIVIRHGWRLGAAYAACALVSAPIVAAYWPKGYIGQFDGEISAVERPFSLDYLWASWRDSLIFEPVMLLVLTPLLVAGCVAVRRWYPLALLLLPTVATAALYSAYYVTPQHPRFLYVTLPMILTLEAAGAVWVVRSVRSRSVRPGLPAGDRG